MTKLIPNLFNPDDLARSLGVSTAVLYDYLAAFEKVMTRTQAGWSEGNLSSEELLGILQHARKRVQGGETLFQAMVVAATSLVW
ncbi:MAG: hypothetical protein JSV66_04910 [Trueperaceae bacterium]|nr:MAG: hypothetical protein JSV66_04910 [Trueperaceae bacterium]